MSGAASRPRLLHVDSSEEDSLLPGPPRYPRRSRSKQSMRLPRIFRSTHFSWHPHPFWLIPVVLVMSMSRGVTMSPRIQVYKAIACRSINKESGTPGVDLLGYASALMAECNENDVQARAAKIQASVVTTMSVLSAISTGFWSRLGDTHGRKLILSTFLLGALLMESVFVLVMKPNSIFGRNAEHFILIGPILEGFVGGLSTFNGVTHAYVSDCTRHGSRSTIFSYVQGMVFVGLATGPWLGGFFFPPKGYSDGYFYGSIFLISITLLYVIFICPESKIPPPPPASTLTGSTEDNGTRDLIRDTRRNKESVVRVARRLFIKFISALLLPISMFRPRRIPGSARLNYNMTFVGLALFLYIVSTGVYSAKYLYAQHVYTWTTAQLGYYMSTLWISRAFNLLVFLPFLLSYLKPTPTSAPNTAPNAHDISKELNFDRHLAMISLFVDGLADALVAVVSNKSQPIFVALSCLSSFTSGGNPALHSLGAVCLHACGFGGEVGALFGAMGVLSAVGHIVSPSIYAITYGSSVANFREAIFVLGACLLFAAVCCLALISPDEKRVVVSSSDSSTGAGGYPPQAGGAVHAEVRVRDYAYETIVESVSESESEEEVGGRSSRKAAVV